MEDLGLFRRLERPGTTVALQLDLQQSCGLGARLHTVPEEPAGGPERVTLRGNHSCVMQYAASESARVDFIRTRDEFFDKIAGLTSIDRKEQKKRLTKQIEQERMKMIEQIKEYRFGKNEVFDEVQKYRRKLLEIYYHQDTDASQVRRAMQQEVERLYKEVRGNENEIEKLRSRVSKVGSYIDQISRKNKSLQEDLESDKLMNACQLVIQRLVNELYIRKPADGDISNLIDKMQKRVAAAIRYETTNHDRLIQECMQLRNQLQRAIQNNHKLYKCMFTNCGGNGDYSPEHDEQYRQVLCHGLAKGVAMGNTVVDAFLAEMDIPEERALFARLVVYAVLAGRDVRLMENEDEIVEVHVQ